ncbi:MAG: methyltransferase domain-containing protein [Actinomycetota bacterium]
MSDAAELDSAAYMNRVRSEIEAAAEALRHDDPELAERERDLRQAWIDVAPPGAAGDERELLLDRAEVLSVIDADAPLGTRRGARELKWGTRKLTYWYLRYVTDQVGAFSNVLVRLLRRLDERVTDLEHSLGLADTDDLIDAPSGPSAVVVDAVADLAPSSGSAIVLSCDDGAIVAALQRRGLATVGVDRDPAQVLRGVKTGLDLRTGDPVRYLSTLPTTSVEVVVLAGFIEDLIPAAVWNQIADAREVLAPGGLLVIAASDPAQRSAVERDLRFGRGVAPETWRHLLARAGADTEVHPVDDPAHALIVTARFA